MFNSKIPKLSLRMMDTECFDVLQSDYGLTRLVDDVLLSDDMPVILGPNLFKSLIRRYNNNTKNLDTFISAVQAR